MDPQAFQLTQHLWPDVAQPFSEIIPHGCAIVRTDDDWCTEPHPKRKRALDLLPAPDTFDVTELAEEACDDAIREGWTPLFDDGQDPCFELEDVHLFVSKTTLKTREAEREVLRVVFDQPWPPDAGAPVHTSQRFQDLVRKLLRLQEDPVRLRREAIFVYPGATEAQRTRELVELPSQENLGKAFSDLAFSPSPTNPERWTAKSTEASHQFIATVTKSDVWAQVQLETIAEHTTPPPGASHGRA